MQYIIANIYGTNCKSSNMLLLYELEKQIADISTMNGKCILGGVFNVVPDNNLNSWPPKGVKYVVVIIIIGTC